MKKLDMLKGSIALAASVGVGIITGNAIKMVKPSDLGLIKKICVGVGSLVLVDIASTKASDHVDAEFNKIFPPKAEEIKTEDAVPEEIVVE